MERKRNYYCVGFFWKGNDPENQLPRFIEEGIWENGFDDKYIEKVKNIPVGSLLAAKTSYTRKKNGETISVLEVHGIGTVTDNPEDGKILGVEWRKDFEPFTLDGRGAYRSTINKVNNQENIELIFGDKKEITEETALSFSKEDLQTKFPFNQILFGPPGTGKTYHTINKAVSIIDNLKEESLANYYESRNELKDRFDELLIYDWSNTGGQIGFVTFHQSMNYEDFVEGIKPRVEEGGEITYDVEPGIFRLMAEMARDNWLDANKGNSDDLSFEDAFQKLKEEWYDNPEMKFPLKREGYDYTITGFSKSSIKFKKASGGSGHTLSISTLQDYYYKRKEVRYAGVGIYYPALIEKLKSYKPSIVRAKEEENYVLIIDEINRGNISQIFGELITLIEEDKRLGKEEAMEVMLAYRKEKFGVPPNLYIIGTMNTADRSVEALDTALRRRFSFTEMPPVYHLDGLNYEFAGTTGREILRVINKRIEKLLDRDHLIGHSYFLKKEDEPEEEKLKDTFYRHVIPLLQEYFYGDYAKIGAVLGAGFVFNEEEPEDIHFAEGYTDIEFPEKEIYQIIDYRENKYVQEGMTFEKAIKQLINRSEEHRSELQS